MRKEETAQVCGGVAQLNERPPESRELHYVRNAGRGG